MKVDSKIYGKDGLLLIEIWRSAKRAALGKMIKSSVLDTLSPKYTSNIFKNRIYFVNEPVRIRKS